MKTNYKFEITENYFHGGQHIAYATSLETAARSCNRHDRCSIYDKGMSQPRCCCGGPHIRHADGSELSYAEGNELDRIYYDMQCGRIPRR